MNKTNLYQFTIIVPIYNEEANMRRLGDALKQFLPQAYMTTCVLFVNDGSSDGSLEEIRTLCKENSDFYYLSFAQNRGLSAAIKAGIDYTQSPYVGYMDADLQTTPEDFNLLLVEAKDYALVTGVRVGRKDTWWKCQQSKFANRFRRMMTGDTAQDTGCPLKVMKTVHAKAVPFFKGMHRFLPAMMLLQHASVKEVPVHHFARFAGQSKFSMRNRLLGPLADCFAYRWMRTRYIMYNINEQNIEA